VAIQIEQNEHPADALALALSRADGIVASIVHCFNEKTDDFVVSDPFMAQALRAVETFLSDASGALTKLYENYDLSIPKIVASEIPEEEFIEQPVAESIWAGEARSYDELLQKVTTAEVFAAEQNRYEPDTADGLLPLLSSIKHDLMKLKSVA
jgi:hypothetical protein